MNGSHERDQSVERLLRQSFATPRDAVMAACLDAETIAAWLDGGLTGSRLEIAQSHVADCARCQSIVGTLARTNSTVPAPEPAPRRWLAWLVPITAVATAIALWVAIPRVDKAPAPQAVNTPTSVFEPKALEPTLDSAQPSAIQAPTGTAQARASDERAADKTELTRSDQTKVAELSKDAPRAEADRQKEDAQASASPATAAPPAAAPAPPASPAARERFGDLSANAVAAKAAGVIVSPDPSIRWRLVGSVVERSTNGGSSWETAFNGGGVTLTAGAAPGTSICWVIGRAGVVLRSTDGRTFSRVAFPETLDLAAVRASDAQTATVSTTDGRTFLTTDGGASWQLR